MARPADILFPERTKALEQRLCMPPPIGCGGPATEFRDELSRQEYGISRLCQKCQDGIFGDEADRG